MAMIQSWHLGIVQTWLGPLPHTWSSGVAGGTAKVPWLMVMELSHGRLHMEQWVQPPSILDAHIQLGHSKVAHL